MVYEIREADWKLLQPLHRVAQEALLPHLLKNSRNSSLPPSTDPRKRTKGLREKSGKRAGGQVGHLSATLSFVGKPARLVIHAPQTCQLCGTSLRQYPRRRRKLALKT